MLILAEGTIHRPVVDDQLAAVRAWFGPMVDSGFLQSGHVDLAGERLWLLVSGASLADASQRLNDLPVVQDDAVTFTMVAVNAVRFR